MVELSIYFDWISKYADNWGGYEKHPFVYHVEKLKDQGHNVSLKKKVYLSNKKVKNSLKFRITLLNFSKNFFIWDLSMKNSFWYLLTITLNNLKKKKKRFEI